MSSTSGGLVDYREKLVEKRLRSISQVVMVTGGKGGVGKSLIASTAALLLSRSSNRTGLLDLDLHGPSSCFILGVKEAPVESEEGLVPPVVEGVKVMSIDLLARGKPLPLRGHAKEEVVKEMLALTAYGELDYLLVDLPPGTGDELLTVSRYVRVNGVALVVTTPTQLAVNVARKVVEILSSIPVRIAGIVENMSGGGATSPSRDLAREMGVEFLGSIPYDLALNSLVGKIGGRELLSTNFAESLSYILKKAGFKIT
ncbi:MAG: P-loop NTPase [Nitrososphaerota archaeon]